MLESISNAAANLRRQGQKFTKEADLDQVPFWNSLDLERKLDEFKVYYNIHRTHASLSGHSPAKFGLRANEAFANINDYGWRQHCRGLFHTPIPA